MAISKIEIGACLNFFNQGGYVLDFNTNDFDNFTGEVVVSLYAQSIIYRRENH